MQAIRSIHEVSEDGFIKIKIPAAMGKKVEVIVLAAEGQPCSEAPLVGQSATSESAGFCLQVLGAAEEEIWNDL